MIARLWNNHRLLTIAFAVAVVLFGVFSVQAIKMAFKMPPRDVREQPLQGWMTTRLVGHSYRLPPEVLGPMLNLEPDRENRRLTLQEVAAQQGIPLDQFLADLEAQIAAQMQAPDAGPDESTETGQ